MRKMNTRPMTALRAALTPNAHEIFVNSAKPPITRAPTLDEPLNNKLKMLITLPWYSSAVFNWARLFARVKRMALLAPTRTTSRRLKGKDPDRTKKTKNTGPITFAYINHLPLFPARK